MPDFSELGPLVDPERCWQVQKQEQERKLERERKWEQIRSGKKRRKRN